MGRKREVAILGGGISGLSLAWYLRKKYGKELSIRLFEKRKRPGGWIETKRQNGFLFEKGPRSLRTSGAGEATLQLACDLKIEREIVFASSAAKRRFLCLNGKLHPLPHSLFSCLTSPLMKGVGRGILRDLTASRGHLEDESIDSFISRRFSPEISARFFDPLTLGIFSGDWRDLSIKSCFPALYSLEKEYRSVLWGCLRKKRKKRKKIPPLFTFQKGLETLPNALANYFLKELYLNCRVERLEPLTGGIVVHTSCGQFFASHVFSTLPPTGIEALSIGVVNLGYAKNVLTQEGFGYLVPTSEKSPLLGVVWDSSVFPEQNAKEETRLTAMVRPHIPRDQMGALAIRCIASHMGIQCLPDEVSVEVAQKAIPQYLIGHTERVAEIERESLQFSPHYTQLGNHLYGVAVNECIEKSLEVSKKWEPVYIEAPC